MDSAGTIYCKQEWSDNDTVTSSENETDETTIRRFGVNGDRDDERWDYEDAYSALVNEFALHGLTEPGTAVVDRSNPFFNLFNQVHDVINNHFNGPKEDESVVTGVKELLRDMVTDLYNQRFRTTQEVADALPSHSIILATRFINPFSGAIASITRYLAVLGHSHLLQIQAAAPTVSGSLHSITAPSAAAAADKIHSLTQDLKAATERISELEANMNDIVDRTTVNILAAMARQAHTTTTPGTRIRKPSGSRARLSSGTSFERRVRQKLYFAHKREGQRAIKGRGIRQDKD
ncbi:hypothetical protein QQX98_010544 [Neonectria punicea]|uniref:Uncharacterized protein n=1 Tax=Neonectria punicea TaxID=979145 RepID=A0ABR1GPN0_9HYPO